MSAANKWLTQQRRKRIAVAQVPATRLLSIVPPWLGRPVDAWTLQTAESNPLLRSTHPIQSLKGRLGFSLEGLPEELISQIG
jgi:hypothetical protein